METVGTLLNFVEIPMACYGAYVLLGLPKTDAISSLGYKAGMWLVTKFQSK